MRSMPEVRVARAPLAAGESAPAGFREVGACFGVAARGVMITVAGVGWLVKEVTVGEVVYRSVVDVERARGALRYAHIPAEEAAVVFGVHGAIAAHYGAGEGTFEPHATTLDYVVAAAAG
jgi:hypothetical protein